MTSQHYAQHYVLSWLLAKKFKTYLDGLRFMGYEFEYQMNRDWFEYHFFVRGNLESIQRINSSLERAVTEHQFS
jgi:hypothetical protein